MSDESLVHPSNEDSSCDTGAPTERDPSRSKAVLPARGIALSVLWWLESEGGPSVDGSAG